MKKALSLVEQNAIRQLTARECDRCGCSGTAKVPEDASPSTRWICEDCDHGNALEYARKNPGWSPELDKELAAQAERVRLWNAG